MVIDEPTLMNALQDIAIKYRLERERTKSVTRTIAKAKQEAILEVIDIVNGMEKMPTVLVQRDQEARSGAAVVIDANPWRYFYETWNNAVVRVRRKSAAWRYHKGDYHYEIDDADQRRFEFWDSWVKFENRTLHEITEAEAIDIIGGKRPWEETQRDHPSN